MIKYEELNIKPISTQNKQGTDKIRDIHVNINTLLYNYSKKYADPLTSQHIIDNLTIYAKQLQELPQNKKRDEIIDKLRQMVKSLIQFKKSFNWQINANTIDCIQRTINFSLRNYLDYKRNNNNALDYNEVIKFLKENHRIYNNIIIPSNTYNKLNITQFISMQDELLKYINSNLSLSQPIVKVEKPKVDISGIAYASEEDDLPLI